MPELPDGTRLSRELAELLIRLTDAYQQRDANGQRQDFVFTTPGGGEPTKMLHRGIPDDDAALDVGDLNDLDDLGFVAADFVQAKRGSFRVTAFGVQAAESIRQQGTSPTAVSERTWRVTFAGNAISPAAAQALDAAGVALRFSRGGGSIGPGETLPEPTNHSAYLRAASGEEAVRRVQAALADHGPHVAFEVEPFDDASPLLDEESDGRPPKTIQLGVASEVDVATPLKATIKPANPTRDWKRRWAEAERDLAVISAPRTDDLSKDNVHSARHDLEAFFVQTYHLKDALKVDAAQLSITGKDIEDAISADPDLALLADLANLDKHRHLDRAPRSGDVPAVVALEGQEIGAEGEWRLNLVLRHDGRTLDGLEIAESAVAAWRRQLEGWGLLSP